MIKDYQKLPLSSKCKKVVRYFRIYGLSRTLIKVAGRSRDKNLKWFFKSSYIKHAPTTSLIGCGQFGFSTISYFLQRKKGNIFLDCFDTNEGNQKSCSEFWGYRMVKNAKELFENPKCKYVYIASDHYSHTPYAIEALNHNLSVHLEKPIAITKEQLKDLLIAKNKSKGTLYAGYNRPYSKAVTTLDKAIEGTKKSLSLGCYVFGHKIDEDHWYRNPIEGTRICGNVGHWLDLSMHLFNIRGYLPERIDISIAYSDKKELDDNISITYVTDFQDLVTIILTSRNEPFEGINETINLQCGKVNAIIDDFRRLTLLSGSNKIHRRYFHKDVGHAKSVMQLFGTNNRQWIEVIYSTLLMITIKDMVLKNETSLSYNIKKDYQEICNETNHTRSQDR